jgi:hypothetical protein
MVMENSITVVKNSSKCFIITSYPDDSTYNLMPYSCMSSTVSHVLPLAAFILVNLFQDGSSPWVAAYHLYIKCIPNVY